MEKDGTHFVAGASFTNITPKGPHYLYGYPFVKRMSTGVHDWLLSSALYMSDGRDSWCQPQELKPSLRLRKAPSKEYGFPTSATGMIQWLS